MHQLVLVDNVRNLHKPRRLAVFAVRNQERTLNVSSAQTLHKSYSIAAACVVEPKAGLAVGSVAEWRLARRSKYLSVGRAFALQCAAGRLEHLAYRLRPQSLHEGSELGLVSRA